MDITRRAAVNASSNKGEIGDEFDIYEDDKVCVSETIISRGYIKEELRDTDDSPEGIYNHVNIKDEVVIDDPTALPQETKFTTNVKGNSLIHDRTRDEFDDCTSDRECTYDTPVIGGGFIKQERGDGEDRLEDIKDEIIEDTTVVSQETELPTNIQGNPLMYCEECDEEYDLYCLKCPMLIRIFDSNKPNKTNNNVRWTLPHNFIDICETSAGVGIVALRAIPKGVVFGPFDGLNLTKDGAVSKWKLKDKKLVCTRDPSVINWMQYIKTADQSSNRNLTPFQSEDRLYYRTDRRISVSDELLVYWDTDAEESRIRDMDNSYWKPRVCERLADTYACTLCCVGYKSMCHLTEHNSRCPRKRNQTYYCEEIIQCAFCKIYLDKKEYLDYHIDRCCCRNTKKKRHLMAHEARKIFACTLCPYKANFNSNLKRHIATHNDDKQFKCDICEKMFKQKVCLARHIRDLHSKIGDREYKCPQCPFETSYKHSLKHHVNAHSKSELFQCPNCDFSTHNKSGLKSHQNWHKKTCLHPEPMIDVK